MIAIDHICLGVQNVFEGALRLSKETGFGYYDGGYFPNFGLANRIFPLGDGTYIEVEGVADVYAFNAGNRAAHHFYTSCAEGDVFMGWCARVDSREELDRIARRLGSDVFEGAMRVRPDGKSGWSARAPDTFRCWSAGLPNFFLVEDIGAHPSRLPSQYGTVAPGGIAWMELGGTEEEMDDYLGIHSRDLGLRFNGKGHGLHAVAVHGAGDTEIAICRPAAKGATGNLASGVDIPTVTATFK